MGRSCCRHFIHSLCSPQDQRWSVNVRASKGPEASHIVIIAYILPSPVCRIFVIIRADLPEAGDRHTTSPQPELSAFIQPGKLFLNIPTTLPFTTTYIASQLSLDCSFNPNILQVQSPTPSTKPPTPYTSQRRHQPLKMSVLTGAQLGLMTGSFLSGKSFIINPSTNRILTPKPRLPPLHPPPLHPRHNLPLPIPHNSPDPSLHMVNPLQTRRYVDASPRRRKRCSLRLVRL